MIKTSFVTTSMMAAIAEAVDIRTTLHQATENLLTDSALAQVAAEVEMATSESHTMDITAEGPE